MPTSSIQFCHLGQKLLAEKEGMYIHTPTPSAVLQKAVLMDAVILHMIYSPCKFVTQCFFMYTAVGTHYHTNFMIIHMFFRI
jgi:hypothetical protein